MTKKIKELKLNRKNNALNIFGLLAIILVFFFAFTLLDKIHYIAPIINDNLNSINYSNSSKTGSGDTSIDLKKELETVTVLLVGRGGAKNDAPDLTDTMILAKINSKKKTISLLSIPRDLYVKYPTSGAGKLNSIYSTYYYRALGKEMANPKDYGMQKLKDKISEITGENIDYYINIDFDGFTQTIDSLGGIEVDVKADLIDNEYPTYNWGYKTVTFKKGIQILSGNRALEYARSRKTTSDYDRSLRQQEVIKSIKNKIKEKFFNNNQKITELTEIITNLYEIFKKNVFTDISLKDSINIIISTKIFDGSYKFISSNINDTCYYGAPICEKGGIVYNPPISVFGTSTELFSNTDPSNISNYELSKKYSNIVLNYPEIGEENAILNIFNSTQTDGIAGGMEYPIKRYGFNLPLEDSLQNTDEPYEKSIIYYNNIDEDSDTINALKTLFNGEFEKLEVAKYSKTNAKIEIIIGEDYLNEKNIFNF